MESFLWYVLRVDRVNIPAKGQIGIVILAK